mgnify:CR=1 FL=1|jgi:hypothetical protein
MVRLKKASSWSFAGRALPFLVLMGAGSWALSQFLKLPVQLKDERKRLRKEGREKFDLSQENDRLQAKLSDTQDAYENVLVPGPRDPNRKAAPAIADD